MNDNITWAQCNSCASKYVLLSVSIGYNNSFTRMYAYYILNVGS